MKKSLLVMWVLVVGVMVCFSAEYTQQEFMKKVRTLGSPEEGTALFCDFIKNAPDLEFAFQLYRMWKTNEPEESGKCMDQIKTDSAFSERLIYLEGADIDKLKDRIAYCRSIIEKNPDAFTPYALMFDTYTTWLFKKPLEGTPDLAQAGVSLEELEALEKDFTKDQKHLNCVKRWKDAGEHTAQALKYLAYHAVYEGRDEEALQLFTEAEKINAEWLDLTHPAIVAARLKRIEKMKEYIDKSAAQWIGRGMLSEDQKGDFIKNVTIYALVTGKAFDQAIDYVTSEKGAMEDVEKLFMVATLYTQKGDTDRAFEILDKAVAKGFDDVDALEQDEDLAPLHSDSRWKTIVAKVKAEWDKGDADRAKAAVALKIEKEAPDWELKDPDGNTWKLSDFKGKKVVVLDFWATWCGPCKISMPELNDWTKKHKPDDVEVFCINTWERNPEEAKRYFTAEKFAMRLLLNGDAVGAAYGVQGIPYMCLVDKEGKIRYESRGYSPALKTNLTYWVNDLLK